MPIDILSASNSVELFGLLAATDISVPSRIEGRNTCHTETWGICRLLSTLGKRQLLQYPLSLRHQDRPDFCIVDAGEQAGVEVTEAVSTQYAAYSALAEREFPEVFLEPAYFRWGAPKLTTDEMRTLLRQDQLTAEPWAGDRPEEEWALFIQNVVDEKLKKLSKHGFEIYPHNWLVIYDNLPLPHIHLTKAIDYLRPLLADRWTQMPSFSRIFVEHGPVIADITELGFECLELHDLWP